MNPDRMKAFPMFEEEHATKYTRGLADLTTEELYQYAKLKRQWEGQMDRIAKDMETTKHIEEKMRRILVEGLEEEE